MSFRSILRIMCKRSIAAASAVTLYKRADDDLKKPTSENKLNLEPPDARIYSHDFMVKQSTINAVNSATESLTITYTAVETLSKEYRNVMSKLISLLRETAIHEVTDEHWDLIVMVRAEVQSKKQVVQKLVDYMSYVHKMAEAATEISYLSGMDNLSTTLCDRIDDALNKMQHEIDKNKMLEDEYSRVQEECVRKSDKTKDDETTITKEEKE